MHGYNRLTLNSTTAVAKNISLFEEPVLKFYLHYICRVVLSFIWRWKKVFSSRHNIRLRLVYILPTLHVWGKQSELHHSSYMEARTSFVVAAFLDLKPGTPKKYDHQFSDSLILKSKNQQLVVFFYTLKGHLSWRTDRTVPRHVFFFKKVKDATCDFGTSGLTAFWGSNAQKMGHGHVLSCKKVVTEPNTTNAFKKHTEKSDVKKK